MLQEDGLEVGHIRVDQVLMSKQPDVIEPQPRSTYSSTVRRQSLPWESGKPFRILSIDGGGIKGIFPAALLAEVESQLLSGRSVADYFDLIAGTSTGGIIALGLACGLTAAELRDVYIKRGRDVFPPLPDNFYGKAKKWFLTARGHLLYRYERDALHELLVEILGGRVLKDITHRLCIPAFEGKHSEVYIFKTPHHPDYHLDAGESMVNIGEATSAAPTYFQPHNTGGYTFVDGGVWANNPVMIGLVDAMTCFDLRKERIHILSLGCGEAPYYVQNTQIVRGGILSWRKIVFAAMHLQSLNALGQARLLVGSENLLRVSPKVIGEPIELDDWRRATRELPAMAMKEFNEHKDRLMVEFFTSIAERPEFFSR